MLFRVFLCFFIIAISLYFNYCRNCSEGLASLSSCLIFSLSLTSFWVDSNGLISLPQLSIHNVVFLSSH
ncbi:hypothetical protein AMTRI_Chr10g2330 [Amborella trichopoda]